MKLSENEIKNVLAIQKRLESKIEAHKKELKILEQNWEILDRVVAESSFTNAADLIQEQNIPDESSDYEQNNTASITQQQTSPSPTDKNQSADTQNNANTTQQTKDPLITPIHGNNTDQIIANAYRTPDYISIMISDDAPLNLSTDVEPFDSFFVKKILEQMKRKDQEEVQNGTLTPQSAMDYDVETDPDTNRIINVIIRNYRDERRATELLNTVGWSFRRMLKQINDSGE